MKNKIIKDSTVKLIKKHKKIFYKCVLILIAFLIIYFTYRFLKHPAKINISGLIQNTGLITANFYNPNKPLYKSHSPACGCIGRNDFYRGIGIFANTIFIRSNKTQNFIFVSPDLVSLNPYPGLRFYFKIDRIVVDREEFAKTGELDFPLNELINESFTHNSIIQTIDFEKRVFLNFISEKSPGEYVSIAQYGPISYNVWNPTNLSLVQLNNQIDDFSITDIAFRPPPNKNVNKILPIPEVPILDMLGTPFTFFLNGNFKIYSNSVNSWDTLQYITECNVPNEILAVTVFTDFSGRLLCLPPLTNYLTPPKTYLEHFINSTLNPNLVSFYFSPKMPENLKENLNFARTLIEERNYKFESGSLHNVKDLYPNFPVPKYFGKDGKKYVLEYPSIPRQLGFSFFGEISTIFITQFKGALTLGSKSYPFPSMAELRLHDVKNITTENGIITIYNNSSTDFMGEADAVYINDDCMYSNYNKYSKIINTTLSLAGILGISFMSLIGLLKANKKKSHLNANGVPYLVTY
jgi:hypothetical protein